MRVDYTIDEIEKEEKIINKTDKIIVFSKLVNGVDKYTADELIKLDPSAVEERKLSESNLYKYLCLKISCIVSLVSSVEVFVNEKLPTNYKYKELDKSGTMKFFGKKKIERNKSLNL